MRRTTSDRRGPRLPGRARAALAGGAGLALVMGTTLIGQAADQPTLETLELKIRGGYVSRAVLAIDTDGDGWCDWYEILQGTDPRDPASHPQSTLLEIVDTTVFVQSTAFPDRLAVIDVALPEGTTKAEDLLDVVGQLAGLSPTGKLHAQLEDGISRLVGGGLLSEMLAAADKAHGGGTGFGSRTNGMDLSLISAGNLPNDLGEQIKFVRENRFEGGTTTDGDPFVRVSNGSESQTHILNGDGGISTTLFSKTIQDDGSVVTNWTQLENGKVVGFGKQTRRPDGSTSYIEYDANGNETGKGGTKPTGGSTGGASGPSSTGGSSQPSSTGGGSTSEPTSPAPAEPTPAGDASPSTYVNPDADPVLIPTQEEIVARVAFLSGIRARFAGTKVELDVTELLPKPGVADPAEPECTKSGCVLFIDVMAPRLSNVNGGDPVRPDMPHGPLPKP